MSENDHQSDKFLIWVLLILAALILVFGIGSIMLAIESDNESVTLRVIGALGAMVTGLIGVAIGYISARK